MSVDSTSEQLKFLHAEASNISVLYVEDDTLLRTEVEHYLKKIFPNVTLSSDGKEGLANYHARPFDIVITDIQMPHMNGLEMLHRIKEINPLQEMIIISAYTESEYFMEAIRLGIDAYILKPINHPQIIQVLYKVVSKIVQLRENNAYRTHLEALVDLKVKEYKDLESEKIVYYEKTLIGLIKMIERRDSYTAGHSHRVADYSRRIAQEMGYDSSQCDLLYRAGILHDIGKIATPDTVLLKPGKLDEIERELIKEHVTVGIEMLGEIPIFDSMIPIIRDHHESYDGSGYPRGVGGDQIDPFARIMIIADAFDAMTTNRIYKPRKSVLEAIQEVESLSGIQFDPTVVPFALRALAHIEVAEQISQLPHSSLEEERFAYFYKDAITGLYNHNYLDVVLLKNSYTYTYRCIHVISLHRFSEFNDEYGWESGNALLHSVAEMLHDHFNGLLLFRIHANDFIIVSQNHFEFEEKLYASSEILLKNHLTCTHFHLDISKNHKITLAELEQRMRDERYKRHNNS
ncbi:MAG: response regulator [Sulfuricurvum sp.]|uniref:HD domain-containing phosphohydrolase n=1 Tax=Sulfuricurvum sp. TaxID=2025608 RepID=UPI00260E6F67|nr:HD domain-containing phosphohydrolase [Sulfuricurvum sp.]MDD2829865.1 response regulator [Sulfuricurvum sp.]MDD4949222.1 response regulator [Sulfuricurvum sp.]